MTTRCLTIAEEIFLNQFSQGLHMLDEMDLWFELYDLLNKRAIMSNLFNMVLQAHPTVDDIRFSAESLGKVKSSSAVMLLNENKPFPKFGYKICELPERELINGFNILLLTLSRADNRRKLEEDPIECNHWWHKDLSDEDYLKELLLGKTNSFHLR